MGTQVASVNSIDGGVSEQTARLGKGGVIGIAIIALIAALVASQVLTYWPSTGREVTTKPPASLSSQDFIEQQRYLEESTTAADTVASYRMINSGGTPAVMPMMNEQQRTLEESTTAANTVAYYRTIDGMTYYDRLASQQEVPKP